MKVKYKVPTQTLNKYNYPNTQYAPTYVKIQFNSNKNALQCSIININTRFRVIITNVIVQNIYFLHAFYKFILNI